MAWSRFRRNGSLILVTAVLVVMAGCLPEKEQEISPAPIRGLVTVLVSAADDSITRRYPGVLEPSELNTLSFEVAGRLGRLNLSVGQQVTQGDLLAQLDSRQFDVTIENRKASIEEVQARLVQLQDDLARSEQLLTRGVVTRVQRDEDATALREAQAQLVQAEKDLASAEEDLADTSLYAPFDGIISSVNVDSFATVGSGTVIATLYEQSAYEVSFSVNFETVAQLGVGKEATIRLADDPTIALTAEVSEIGKRADTVSSFPVVVRLTEDHPLIRAGMAVEVEFEIEIPAEEGFLIPVSAAIPEGQIPELASITSVTPLEVYVFEPDTSTVTRRAVSMGGIRDNRFLIVDGLTEGERVASAGVTFLREGMEVKLLEVED
ncbi:MAG: efflux RND transporter periplasmic adaptor subunit [Pseudomonadota bacterium]